MSEKLEKARSLLESSSADQAVPVLQELQVLVAQASIFSKNEGLEEITTKSLPFLCIDHYLAVGLTQVTTRQMENRLANLRTSCDLFDSFLHRIDSIELLSERDKKDFETSISKDFLLLMFFYC